VGILKLAACYTGEGDKKMLSSKDIKKTLSEIPHGETMSVENTNMERRSSFLM
jgi:hypothetical protein